MMAGLLRRGRLRCAARGALCLAGALAALAALAVPRSEAAQSQARYLQALQAAIELLPPGSQVAALVRDESGAELLSHNAGLLLQPASTLKLITAAAAQYALGSDYRFVTRLAREQNGDAVMQFSGDPLFTRPALRRLLVDGRSNGLPDQLGRLLLDGSAFDGHAWSDAQGWDDRHTCFAAPASAISLDRNCFRASVRRGAIGQIASVDIAGNLPVSIRSDARIVSPLEQQRRFCRLELRHASRGDYGLFGCASPGQLPLDLRVAVVDPESYVSWVVGDEARRLGIDLGGGVVVERPSRGVTPLAEHRSRRLDYYLRRMLMVSDNQIADVVFKAIGAAHFAVPGNYRVGAAAVREVLLERAGIDLGNSVIADGSGLSPHNQLTADQLLQVLQRIAAMPGHSLFDALPVAGVSGTLKHRYGLAGDRLKGRIRAKTGYVNGNHNLAGYFTDSRNRRLTFVLFVSSYSLVPERGDTVGGSAAAAPAPVDRFFQTFFEGIL